jgi:hypothetical protein
MLTEVKLLSKFTNQRGILPELTLIHVLEDGEAWASDGEIELRVKTKLPHKENWSVNAEELANLLTAAGAKSEVEVAPPEVMVFSADFSGKVPVDRLTKPPASLVQVFRDSVIEASHKVLHPKAFTQALTVAAPFAASDAAVGVKWTGVALRGDTIYASDQGFVGIRIKLRHPIKFTDGSPAADLAIPARAVALLAELGEVTQFDVANKMGLGAFTFASGAFMVFRMLDITSKGNELPIERMDSVICDVPGKEAWGLTAAPSVLLERLVPLAAPKDGRRAPLACTGSQALPKQRNDQRAEVRFSFSFSVT